MRGNDMRAWNNERGVAMVTVLLVAAVMTAAASAAAFMTVREFRAGADDRRGTTALSYAEAGIDRFILLARGGTWTWQQLVQSGCGTNALVSISGNIGSNGTYKAEVRPQSCPSPIPSPRNRFRVSITSTGQHPTATRIVQQIADLRPKGLPIGTYALKDVIVSGFGSGPTFNGQSLVAGGKVDGRDVLAFTGDDLWYKQGNFYGAAWVNAALPIPAAVHAGGDLICQGPTPCGGDRIEHTADDSDLNCTANPAGTAGQSAWDGSREGGSTDGLPSCGHPRGSPPTSRFTSDDAKRLAPTPNLTDEDYRALKATAQTSGIYCVYKPGGKGTCTGPNFPNGTSAPSTWTGAELTKMGVANNFVAYFDHPQGTMPTAFSGDNTVTWNTAVAPCSSTPTINRSVAMIIPNGSLSVGSSGTITGGVIAPRGQATLGGGAVIHGSLIATELVLKGSSNFVLDTCWLNNMPALYLDVVPVQWRELDGPL